jgi:hypothetical protein
LAATNAFEDIPAYIVVHIGGNDLGETRLGLLHYKLKRFMMWLSHKMPLTQLIYSQILPRTYWRYSSDNNKIDKCRRRLNSSIGSLMVKNPGLFLAATNAFLTREEPTIQTPTCVPKINL